MQKVVRDPSSHWASFLSFPKHMAVAPIVLGMGLLVPPVAGELNMFRARSLANSARPLTPAERNLAETNTTKSLFNRLTDNAPPPSPAESIKDLGPTLVLFKKVHPGLHAIFMEAVNEGRIEIGNLNRDNRGSFAEYYPSTDSFFIHSQTFLLSDGQKVLVLAHEASHRAGRVLESISCLTLDRSVSTFAHNAASSKITQLRREQAINGGLLREHITDYFSRTSRLASPSDPQTQNFHRRSSELESEMRGQDNELDGWIKDGQVTFSNPEVSGRIVERGISKSLFAVEKSLAELTGEPITDHRPRWLQKLTFGQSLAGAFLIVFGVKTKLKAIARKKVRET